MKVLHVPFCYYPDPVGGTEVYVGALTACQAALGLTVSIAAPGSENAEYIHEGSPVYRFAGAASLDLRDLYGTGDAVAAARFDEILQRTDPDIVHLHAFTSAVSLRLAEAVRRRNLPFLFTYHTPTVTCSRGTLLLWGKGICDGVMQAHRCAGCALHAHGVPKPAAWMLGRLPSWAGGRLGAAGFSGGAWTALEMSELIRLRHAAAQGLFKGSTRVIAVCGWVHDLLVRNGVAPEKITLCRQGLAYSAPPAVESASNMPALPVRIAFLGRLDRVKGVDVLIEALRTVPDLPVTLDIFAVCQGGLARGLKAALLARIGHDARMRFCDPLAPTEIVPRLRGYHALAVPSRWMETGPMVVYEAFAAGIPVIGSNLGGIAELVEHGTNGLLVEDSSAGSWAGVFRQFVEDRELLPKLRRGIGAVRTMRDVAGEMQPLYEAAIRRSPQPAPAIDAVSV